MWGPTTRISIRFLRGANPAGPGPHFGTSAVAPFSQHDLARAPCARRKPATVNAASTFTRSKKLRILTLLNIQFEKSPFLLVYFSTLYDLQEYRLQALGCLLAPGSVPSNTPRHPGREELLETRSSRSSPGNGGMFSSLERINDTGPNN